MKNILVLGHPRSGNHFLINTIGLNFDGYVADTWRSPFDAKNFRLKIVDVLYRRCRRFSKIIFKSHLESCFFNESWDFFKKRFHVFYMIRDGRDVMTSYFFYTKRKERLRRLKINKFSTFLRYNISDSKSFRTIELNPSFNLIKRWVRHIENWIKIPDIHIIRYEDLNLDFDNTLNRIGKILGQTPKGIRPHLKRNISMIPRKGIVGDYKNVFSKRDLDYFNGIVGNLMKKLNYE